MVKDFRNVGRLATKETTAPDTPDPAGGGLATNRRVIVMALYLTAAGFLVAGIWLLVGSQSIFSQDIARLMGIALVISSISDVVAIFVIKRVWARQHP
jgi:hypothetical protein